MHFDGMRRKGDTYIVGGKRFEKQYGISPQNQKQNYQMIQWSHFWIYDQKKGNLHLRETSALPSSLQHYSQ